MNINQNRLTFEEKQFDELVEELRDLLFSRKCDYNNLSLVYDYFPHKPESFDTMIYIKTLRELNKSNQFQFDSLKDLILYSMFKLSYYKQLEKKGL